MSELQEIATRFQVQLEGLKTNEHREFNSVLKEVVKNLEDALGGKEITSLSRKQVESLIKDLNNVNGKAVDGYVDDLIVSLKELAKYSYEFEAGAIVAGSAVDKVSEKVSMAALWKRVQEHPLSIDGSLLDTWVGKLTDVQKTATENVIRRAYSEGWTNNQLMQAYRGTRINKFRDGIVEKLGRSNETVIRTAMQHVNSVSRLAVWEDNADTVEKYRWVSTLDTRTSSTCRGLDGQEFNMGEGPLPPIHPNCRSTTVPVLAKEFEEFRKGMTRASKTGPVPQTMTYYDWLKNQSAAFQDSVLGKIRGKLLRDGGLTADQFSKLQLNRFFEPLTLEEMRKLKPLAFQRAGI